MMLQLNFICGLVSTGFNYVDLCANMRFRKYLYLKHYISVCVSGIGIIYIFDVRNLNRAVACN